MDPSTLLMAEVAGMMLIALIATAVLIRDDVASAKPSAAEEPTRIARTVPVTLFCPTMGDEALVGLSAVSKAPGWAELTVAECEYLPHGTVACDMACLEAAPRA